MPTRPTSSRAARQRGAATLFTTIIVLVLMTMIAFFANRGVIFESKTAANQYRSTKAIEAADAGLEWALANLNTFRRITTGCATSTASGSRTFRDRYLDPDGDGSFASRLGVATPATMEPFATTAAMCTRSGAGWSCSCPAEGTPPAADACTDPQGCPTFRVSFSSVRDDDNPANPQVDPTLVRVTAVGCTDAREPCVPGAGTADGTAEVNQVFKLASALATLPAAAITAKGYVDFGSNAITATNTDPGTNGVTINAGLDITGFINDSTIDTLPGTPVGASLIGNDTSLASLTDDQMFRTFFGSSKEQFRDSPATTIVNCSGVCNTTLLNAIAGGARTIWVEGDMVLNANDVFGSLARPVMLVVNGNIEVRGNMTFYGVLYCQDSTWDNTGGGNAQIIGAAISEGNFTATGTPDPTYDPRVLQNLRQTTGQYAKVPGGWRDYR
ncbi:pilus assembly PilX family protein [Quisquiliibacterium transsilvanicum]|uniref:Tfp pilus assembly protein PilX n=1 Tax=Quisquiliibacterium transsilvanicum TaxID=1549638 RepID=A0A7W8HID7_9BURK|nr:pilus assembly PilX N-terminal domain-containing protein [Quisquiliibacterium transsilvanicum]MBB5272627.1 Tfp pilus assembly protein PilX [Quisquiliibacterium transsilvanicum]